MKWLLLFLMVSADGSEFDRTERFATQAECEAVAVILKEGAAADNAQVVLTACVEMTG